jgi:hypothetical protein
VQIIHSNRGRARGGVTLIVDGKIIFLLHKIFL